MGEQAVLLFAFLMLSISGFFLFFLVLWNRKSLKNQRRIHELQAARNRELLRATINGQEVERKRLAENLHDDIGPLLSALKMQSKGLIKNDDKSDDFIETLELAIKSVRRVSSQMSPAVFEELGLSQGIHHIVSRFEKYEPIKIKTSWDASIDNILSSDFALSVYRIIQECLTNIYRHASAKKIDIVGEVLKSKNTINISIKDDGKGFSPPSDENCGLGLKNIKARVESMNGDISISSSKQGTLISIIIPQNQNENNKSRTS